MGRPICAVSTPRGKGGIAVIRASGDGAIELTSRVFRSKSDLNEAKGYTILHGGIYDGEKKLDDVLVSVFCAPHSFTGEDVCEISCHGGVVVTESILGLLLRSGFALAEAGEFTKRAFLNGKMSLTQAEAVHDIIEANTSSAASAAVNRLDGALTKEIGTVRDKIVRLCAAVQVSTDFPDEEPDAFSEEPLYKSLVEIKNELEKIRKRAERGIYLAGGARCAICGEPNVGKSSLLNFLAGEEKAIVSDISGTTRDALEARCEIGGVMVTFIDTAGIRETEDKIENLGIKKAKDVVAKADFVIFAAVSGSTLSPDEEKMLSEIKKPVIKVLNKCDEVMEEREGYLSVSVLTGEGMDALKDKIAAMLLSGDSDAALVANERQRGCVIDALDAINRALATLDDGFYADLAVIDILDAAEKLGEIEGFSVNDEVIDRIFKEFCLGK
ncbi:MAG: tRNA uridine-5-carboxymethylaminomethyl(34) synthesis GTPase MnmE [Clostridia bacterium]|nr:tRNA uridine-5-carboxymethylaminomethyl(34) synthesis GTPase MnmE [Clostridia bacterium]